MWHHLCAGVGEVHTWFWWRNLRDRHQWEELPVDERIILKWMYKKLGGEL